MVPTGNDGFLHAAIAVRMGSLPMARDDITPK